MTEMALQISGLVKIYPNFTLGALDLNVPKGAIYGLVGANGAGKTTTIDLIMGMGAPNGGEIKVFGMDNRAGEAAIKKQVGYVSPDLNFNAWGKVSTLLNFVRGFYPDWDDAYCADLMKRLNINWNEKIAALSYGARMKLSLVSALSHRPALLLLDEPLAGLDAISKNEVFTELLDAVQDDNRTVLISSHNLDDIERFTDHLGIIHEGKMMLEGPTSALIERFCMVDCQIPNEGLLRPSGALRVQKRSGNRHKMLVDRACQGMDQLAYAEATDITTTPVTLEELFVALAKDNGR